MDRKAMAQETLRIIRQGSYATEKGRIEIKEAVERSVRDSVLISPEEGERILAKFSAEAGCGQPETRVENISTVEAVRLLAAEGRTDIGVLNFASAKNPGGGFLNGAKAQEESLTVSGALYPTLTAHPEYYEANRANRSMMYLDYGIYSPEVVLFRDGAFRLTDTPVRADVLTLPAVNMGQVLLKGEDGAYGCSVFRNDPREIAAWWRELMEEGMGRQFASVFHAVLDSSREQACIRAFENSQLVYNKDMISS